MTMTRCTRCATFIDMGDDNFAVELWLGKNGNNFQILDSVDYCSPECLKEDLLKIINEMPLDFFKFQQYLET